MRGSSLKKKLYSLLLSLSARAVQIPVDLFYAVAEMHAPREFSNSLWSVTVAVILPFKFSAKKFYTITPFLKSVINNSIDSFISFSENSVRCVPCSVRRCNSNQVHLPLDRNF